MGQNVLEKIMAAHQVSGTLTPGTEVAITIDHTLIQDATGTMTLLQFEAIGVPRVKTKRSVAYVDHNTIQPGFEGMDDHLFMESASRKFGLYFSRPGNGICHQVHLERFSVPGETLLGQTATPPPAVAWGCSPWGRAGWMWPWPWPEVLST
jgi:aconitate hydratase